jgi:hypothetical protein
VSRRKSFVYDMYPQDFNDGVKGLHPSVVGIYIMLINLMRVEGGPLPPRKLKKRRDEFDEWIRDKLGLKNVKTWLNAKRVLLGDPDKLVELPDGRVANPRTERDRAPKSQQGGGGQGSLPLRAVSNDVDDRGTGGEEAAASPEVRQNFQGTSEEVLPIGRSKPLILAAIGCASPYPCIHIPLQVAAARTRCRARDSPAWPWSTAGPGLALA